MATKKLGQSNILSMEDKVFEKKEIKVTANGEEFTVTIDTKFKDVEIAKVFTELVKRSDYAKKGSLDFDITATMLVLLLKHFTDIEFQETNSMASDIDIEIRTLNALINLGLLEQILENFDKKEIERLSDMLEKHEDGIKYIANNLMASEVFKNATV